MKRLALAILTLAPVGLANPAHAAHEPSAGSVAAALTVDVRDWGVAADASASANTAALRAAMAYAISSGTNDLTLPPFRFSIDGEVVGAPTTTFRIHGTGGTIINLASLAQRGLVINSDSPVTFEGFGMATRGENDGSADGGVVPTAGSCIFLSGARQYNRDSRFRGLDLNGCYLGIDTESAAGWHSEAVFMHSIVKGGYAVANGYNADIGDSTINGGFIGLNGNYNAEGIIHYSSGGLKVSDTKVLNPSSSGRGTCYTLYPTAGTATSDLQFSNFSCENVQRGLYFKYYTSTRSRVFQHVNVTNSHFNYVKWPISEADGGTGSPWLDTVVVVGGNMLVANGGTGFSFNNVPYVSIAGTEVICVQGGTCTGLSAGPKTTGSAIFANYATRPFSTDGATGFTAINTAGGGLSINQGGKVGVTCSGSPSASFASTNGVVTHC